MHPRVSVSAISTFTWDLPDDLAFYARAGITNVGISVAKLEQHGWDDGAARNLALNTIPTPFVVFWDADDVMLPGTLSAMRRRLEGTANAVAVATAGIHNDAGALA